MSAPILARRVALSTGLDNTVEYPHLQAFPQTLRGRKEWFFSKAALCRFKHGGRADPLGPGLVPSYRYF